MSQPAIFEGEGLYQLLPQRPPITMIDALFDGNDDEAHTGLLLQSDNFFCTEGYFTEPGVIEHQAQSAAAMLGYTALRHQQAIPLGYIGEIKKFSLSRLPRVGEALRTHIQLLSEVMNILLVSVETTTAEGEIIASCRMKLSVDA